MRRSRLRTAVHAAIGIGLVVLAAVYGTRDGTSRAPRAIERELVESPSVRVSDRAKPSPVGRSSATVVAPRVEPADVEARAERVVSGAAAQPGRVADVRTYGAKGDGRANDTDAIQRANDAMAEGGRGGRVFFPRGTYRAAGILQDSFVEFDGADGAVIEHPDPRSGKDVIQSRVHTGVGSIRKGANVVSLADTTTVVPGAVVAVRGAGGGSSTQYAPLTIPMTASDSTMRVKHGFGFSAAKTYTTNHLLVGDEIVSYTSLDSSTFGGLVRGLYGTRARSHARGTRVAQLNVLYAHAASVGPDRIVLDRPARVSVQGAPVSIGSVGMSVRNLTIDGSRPSGGVPNANPFPVSYSLASSSAVTGCTIRNGDHGAVNFDKGTERSVIAGNVFMDNGTPSSNLGSAVWLFRGTTRNVVRDNRIGGDSKDGVTIDDRTIASTEWDAEPTRNVVEDNDIDIRRAETNAGVWVLGGSHNTVRANTVRGTLVGIRVYTGGQSPVPPPTTDNLVTLNALRDHHIGLWTNGSNNRFVDNRQTDVDRETVDDGRGNQFS